MRDLREIHDTAREMNIPVMKNSGMSFLLEYLKAHENIRDILECGKGQMGYDGRYAGSGSGNV